MSTAATARDEGALTDHDIVVVGSVNADLVVEVERHPHPGETLLGRSGSVLVGGKGANQAVAAARLGARAAMIGAVGRDPYAAVALSELRRSHVDPDQVCTVDGATGLAVVTLADDGENSIVVIPGANASVTAAVVGAAASTTTGSLICVLQAEIPLDAVRRAADVAALAVGLARGESVEHAALRATRVAAYSVQRLGAQRPTHGRTSPVHDTSRHDRHPALRPPRPARPHGAGRRRRADVSASPDAEEPCGPRARQGVAGWPLTPAPARRSQP